VAADRAVRRTPKIRVRSLDELRSMTEKSIDLVVITRRPVMSRTTGFALAVVRRLLKPAGRWFSATSSPPCRMAVDVFALLRFAAKCGF